MLDPRIVGQEHYEVARGVQQILQKYKELQDISRKYSAIVSPVKPTRILAPGGSLYVQCTWGTNR